MEEEIPDITEKTLENPNNVPDISEIIEKEVEEVEEIQSTTDVLETIIEEDFPKKKQQPVPEVDQPGVRTNSRQNPGLRE